ncbi:MAG: hypothetical protein N3F62_08070 [Bacteroidia bacterium]|jgi:hypothetical protein|nr:hypothetical protein [Bacteroidia bacterium]GIV28660.1 MAG: hypothetical protein KatS3mg027_2474 [Bacteroidia bacterium]
MKKILIFVLSIILIGTIVYYLFLKRTPYSIASNIAGFKVPTSLTVEQFQDNWINNPGGDGELFILFSFQESEKENLVTACKMNNYKPLPINDTLPDNFIYRYIKKENQSGFYKLEKDREDKRNYQITILNLQENKLIIYTVIY